MTDVFHVYDPENGILCTEPTLEAAIEAANQNIKDCWYPDSGDEWSFDVELIAVYEAPADCADPRHDGKEVARARPFNIQLRPDDTDEDGWSEKEQDHWAYGSYESVCDYRVEPANV